MEQVKRPKKPLMFYYTIVLIILILFNIIAMPYIKEKQIKDVDYGTFISMTEKKEIKKVELQQQDNTILFTGKDGKTIYKTAMVNDPDLTKRLYEADVSFYGEEIDQSSPIPVNILSSCFLNFACGIGRIHVQKIDEAGWWGKCHVFRNGKKQCEDLCEIIRGNPFP